MCVHVFMRVFVRACMSAHVRASICVYMCSRMYVSICVRPLQNKQNLMFYARLSVEQGDHQISF